MRAKTGAVAINGWQALSAHGGIVAAEAKAAAAKALAKAEADLVVITKAEAVAAKGGVMSGIDITAAVHTVFVAAPDQSRTSLSSKAQGATFLAALSHPWTTLLVPARAARQAAIVAAGAAREAADAADAAAVADHQPPAAPSVVAASAVTAASVDVDSMSSAEKRALLAKLGVSMGDE